MLINFCAKHKNSLAAPRYFSYLIKMINKCFVFGYYISERSDCSSFFDPNSYLVVYSKCENAFFCKLLHMQLLSMMAKLGFKLLLQIGWKCGAKADRIFAYKSIPLLL